jgi:hypothetical protein
MSISDDYARELVAEIMRIRAKCKRVGDMLLDLMRDCAEKYPEDPVLLGNLGGIAMCLIDEAPPTASEN